MSFPPYGGAYNSAPPGYPHPPNPNFTQAAYGYPVPPQPQSQQPQPQVHHHHPQHHQAPYNNHISQPQQHHVNQREGQYNFSPTDNYDFQPAPSSFPQQHGFHPNPTGYLPQHQHQHQNGLNFSPHAESHIDIDPSFNHIPTPPVHYQPESYLAPALGSSSVPILPLQAYREPTPGHPVHPVHPAYSAPPVEQTPSSSSLKLKIPAMAATRRITRASTVSAHAEPDAEAAASGSEYSGASDQDHEQDASMEAPLSPEKPESPVYSQSTRGRRIAKKSYVESSDIEYGEEDGEEEAEAPVRRSGRSTRSVQRGSAAQNGQSRHGSASVSAKGKAKSSRNLQGLVVSDDEDEKDKEEEDDAPYGGRKLRARKVVIDEDDVKPKPYRGTGRYGTRGNPKAANANTNTNDEPFSPEVGSARGGGRLSRSRAAQAKGKKQKNKNAEDDHDDGYVDQPSSDDSGASFDAAAAASPPLSEELDAEGEPDADADGSVEVEEQEQDDEPRGYGLRKRTKVNYAIPPPLEDMAFPPPAAKKRPKPKPARSLGWSATGAQLSKWMGDNVRGAGDDSDSDAADYTAPVGALGGSGAPALAGGAGGAYMPGDMGAGVGGGPSNMGRMGDAALADADPLGVNPNVTFDAVGGLDAHIDSLKEMTLLPLLYPEVFQRFNLTPPRGVLFHGPPGTGKTLLARALAASCRSDGRSISFFMRKGADCLSKWVGEAERQLRLLFDEAKACQPSIIFFDEIDGLAPVRSSKQDQVHASIVSTLLALMDGMDGRGQVVVIGATNRPDAIDPALRRPGRFDREFYFPLPAREARERIIRIMTKSWDGWDGPRGEENAKTLSELTKGYGGADLRALATEAALNAVQRRYPQIYKSTERLMLKPETIEVELRDFMLAVKKLVPSSARSTSATAAPLPPQLVPLLEQPLEDVKAAIHRVMPVSKKRSALEEAQYEGPEHGAGLQRELLLQSMETLRVYRPRIALYGAAGAGQSYVAAAALHHLEGYHVQSLALGNLLSDSTRTLDAAIVQLFLEAKRNPPAVVHIPSLSGWCEAVPASARATVRAMLDSLAPTDPILLLAVVDGSFGALPRDVKSWFGPARANRVLLGTPSEAQRAAFFAPLFEDVQRPPDQFPEGVPRRKRVLEDLPLAPPLEPRAPTAAELQAQVENDGRTIALLKFRLAPIVTELKKKFKRFTKPVHEEYEMDDEPEVEVVPELPIPAPVTEVPLVPDGVMISIDTVLDGPDAPIAEHINGIASGSTQMQAQLIPPPALAAIASMSSTMSIDHVSALTPVPAVPSAPTRPQLHNMDLEKIHSELYKSKYLTPADFLLDVAKIRENAERRRHEDGERALRANALYIAAEVSLLDVEPQLKLECERMAVRERRRRAERKEERAKAKAAESAAASGGRNGIGSRNGSGTPVEGVRRSGRTAGGPRIEVDLNGDPTALERRLKRARSSGGTSASPRTPASVLGVDDPMGTEGRSAKRSRLHDEADGADGNGGPEDDVLPGPPSPRNRQTSLVGDADTAMSVASPQPSRAGGFDPSLLNPAPQASSRSFDIAGALLDSLHPVAVPSDADASVPTTDTARASPFPESQLSQGYGMQLDTPLAPPVPPRTPTPPRPDFIVPEPALDALRTRLSSTTAALSVEQLEQLRAACIGAVWRAQSAWDRTVLVGELEGVVAAFVRECEEWGEEGDDEGEGMAY